MSPPTISEISMSSAHASNTSEYLLKIKKETSIEEPKKGSLADCFSTFHMVNNKKQNYLLYCKWQEQLSLDSENRQ